MEYSFWSSLLVQDEFSRLDKEPNTKLAKEENMAFWNTSDKGLQSNAPGYVNVALISPAHILLAFVILYSGIPGGKCSLGKTLWKGVFRLLITGALFGLPLAQVFGNMLLGGQSSVPDVVFIGLTCITLLVQALHTFNCKRRNTGLICKILLYSATFVAYCLSYYGKTSIQKTTPSLFGSMSEYYIYFSVLCHLVYVLTVKIFNQKKQYDSSNLQKENNQRSTSQAKQENNTDLKEKRITEEGISIYSSLTYNWVWPILKKGCNKVSMTTDDMFLLPDRLDIWRVQERFHNIFKPKSSCGDAKGEAHCKSSSTEEKPITLFRALFKAYAMEYFVIGGLLELSSQIIGLIGPLTLNLLISYFENKNEPEIYGYWYAFVLFFSKAIIVLLHSRFDYYRRNVFFSARTCIMTTIYRKVLRISTVSMTKFSSGEIINFLGSDTDRIMGFFHCFHALWSLPLEIVLTMIILYQLVGSAFLGGLAVALFVLPINKWIASKQVELGKTLMEQKDARTKMMNEILNGIKIIKFYTWEDHFRAEIEKLRTAELNTMRYRKCLGALTSFLWTITPVLMTILTFTMYTMMGQQLTAAKIFTSLTMFLNLLGCLNHMPWVFNALTEAKVSLKRVENFVALRDMDLNCYYTDNRDLKEKKNVVSIKAGKFSWEEEESQNTIPNEKETEKDKSGERTSKSGTLTLRDITIDIQQGQFIGVIGKVGSGKTSLLNALLAEMCREGGHIALSNIEDGFALAEQEAWIQHASIRDNILFGRPFDAKKYANVIDAASLHTDLKALPAGDNTEVGENGVTLSGGQKARVALARSLYQDKDIYLLDDPLAAVDAHVAQHMYEKCIMGLLKNKTRILCTHHTKFLGSADLVIQMDDGVISKMGPPSEVLSDTTFADHHSSNKKETTEEYDMGSDNGDGKLVEEESKEKGEVKLEVYKAYFTALGKWLGPVLFLTIILMEVFEKMKDWWLTHWVEAYDHSNMTTFMADNMICPAKNVSTQSSSTFSRLPYPNNNETNATTSNDNVFYHMTVYGCLAVGYSLFSVAREILFVFGGMRAAKSMHSNLVNTILKAPMSFFTVTPIGRIVNRFSSDVGTVDGSIANMINVVITQVFGLVGTVFISCYGLPWFTVILLPIGVLYYKVQQYYRHTSREIRRICSATRSPIYAHFSETVSGLTTIRAFRATERFHDQHFERLDKHLGAHFTACSVGSWLGLRTEMMGVFMVSGIALLAVVEHHFQAVDPALVGLAISYTLSLSGLLNGMVNCFSETEKQMVSVERVQQYIEETPSEKWDGCKSERAWPSTGVITYKDVNMKYREGLPNVLNGLGFKTVHAEKIGIVGRTGSGKSSLFQTLFRTVEISSGEILIDGVNIKELDLKDVRRHLAVIPQDPFLFSGTVKENLDPTMTYSDDELWEVLERCHLRLPVERLGGLKGDVAEKGRHFSMGQRQLMCLARALLTKAKILCIDEATASVDLETDKLIQETIRKEFANSTVLTIAHRTNTIMDSDRVLVLDNGRVAEMDSPKNLLKDPKSAFYQLVHGEKSED